MATLENLFRTDANIELSGIEYEIRDEAGNPSGIVLLLARAGGANKKFELAKEKAYRALRAKKGKGVQFSDEDHIECMIPVFAQTVVINWFYEDPETKERKPTIPFSDDNWKGWDPESAEQLLRMLPRTRLLDVMEIAADYAAYKEDVEDILGNSSNS